MSGLECSYVLEAVKNMTEPYLRTSAFQNIVVPIPMYPSLLIDVPKYVNRSAVIVSLLSNLWRGGYCFFFCFNKKRFIAIMGLTELLSVFYYFKELLHYT